VADDGPGDELEGAPTYLFEFGEDSSYGSALRLLAAVDPPGLLLDIGCGYAAIAERLIAGGWTYVGLDADPRAVEHLRGRGIEAHLVDLDVPEDGVLAAIEGVLDGRPPRAVCALDVLEHLIHADDCVRALSRLAADRSPLDLVVSLPNVTHLDVAAKLLAGRWETTLTGLLDRTHVRFFDEVSAGALLTEAGWQEVARDDVHTAVTEQASPPDLPTVRPGTPLNDLLRVVRDRAGRGGSDAFQYVRRYRLADQAQGQDPAGHRAPPDDGPDLADLAVVALPGVDLDQLATSIRAQTHRSLIVAVLGAASEVDLEHLAAAAGLPPDAVVAVRSDADVVRLPARYVAPLGAGVVLHPEWAAQLAEAAVVAPGRVLVAGCRDEAGQELAVARFDLITDGLSGTVAPGAYAIPRMAVVAGVAAVASSSGPLAASLARAASWCGRYDLEGVTVAVATARPLDGDEAAVVAELDADPLLLAPGSMSPLLALRERALRAESGKVAAESALAEHSAHHQAYARAMESLVEELRDELARDPMARALTRVARALRRLARR